MAKHYIWQIHKTSERIYLSYNSWLHAYTTYTNIINRANVWYSFLSSVLFVWPTGVCWNHPRNVTKKTSTRTPKRKYIKSCLVARSLFLFYNNCQNSHRGRKTAKCTLIPLTHIHTQLQQLWKKEQERWINEVEKTKWPKIYIQHNIICSIYHIHYTYIYTHLSPIYVNRSYESVIGVIIIKITI